MNETPRILLNRRFPRSVSALPEIFDSVRASLEGLRTNAEKLRTIEFGIEEVFTNMVKYNPKGPAELTIRVSADGNAVRTDVVDPDSDEFDPWSRPTPDLQAPIEQRRPGGLGIHLVKTMFSDVRYEYTGRVSTVTLIQTLE